MADKQRVAQSALSTNTGIAGADGSDISDAATAWEAMLGQDEAEDHDDHTDGEDELADGQDGQEGEPEDDEESEDEPEDEGEEESEDDDEDDDDGEEAPAAEIDPATKVKVKVDGEEVEVTLEELRDGYSRTQDYTRKTQEVAEQRRAVEQEKAQVLEQQQQWGNLLTTFQQRLQATLSGRTEAEWQALKQQDEIAYYEERDKERSVQERIQAIQQEQQRVAQEYQQHTLKQQQEWAKAELEKLPQVIEEWKDPEVQKREVALINAYGASIGFTPQELQGVVDHRAIKVLRDAAKYQELAKAKQAPDRKKVKRKVQAKTMQPGTPSNQKPSTVKKRKASQRLAREHSVDAAASVFEHLLDD